MRRADKEMSVARAHELLASAYCGRLATVGIDGSPYICPLLFVWTDGRVWMHNASDIGHLQRNVRHESRVCFEIDIPGQTYAYGRYQCDTALEYQSVVVFGRLAIVEERGQKARFFDLLMDKYYARDADRPKGFYPRLDDVTVYSLLVDRITGKETTLPTVDARWPAVDKTKSPTAVPPSTSE